MPSIRFAAQSFLVEVKMADKSNISGNTPTMLLRAAA